MAQRNSFIDRFAGRPPLTRASSSSRESSPESPLRPRHSAHYSLDETVAPPARSEHVQRDSSERVRPVARGFPYSIAPASPPPFARASPRGADRAYGSRSSPFFAGPHGGFDDSPPRGRARASEWAEREGSSRSSASSLDLTARGGKHREDTNVHATPPAQNHVTRVRQRTGKSRSNSAKTEKRRLSRQCTIDGCDNYTIDRGLCFRHGGGKVCMIEGCTSSAKARGVCWRHGGSVLCTVEGCKRGAKSKGLCWSHGGGTKCSVDGCDKTTISKGLCWTHGGGKRCLFDGCKRPASEKMHNFCPTHMAQVSQKDFVFEV